MKIRNGFVSNSSSTCYILDRREPETERFLKCNSRFIHPNYTSEIGRGSVIMLGPNILSYATVHREVYAEWNEIDSIAGFIGGNVDKIGVENAVLVLRSDEGSVNEDLIPFGVQVLMPKIEEAERIAWNAGFYWHPTTFTDYMGIPEKFIAEMEYH